MNRYVLSTAVLVALQMFGLVSAREKLTESRFRELMSSIVPVEKSGQIEWQPDLLVAQKIALEQKKPIFIWSMDGHPLGCT